MLGPQEVTLSGSVALLEEVWHCGGRLRDLLYAQAMPSVAHSLLLLPVDQDVELSAPLALCVPACCHASHHDELNL